MGNPLRLCMRNGLKNRKGKIVNSWAAKRFKLIEELDRVANPKRPRRQREDYALKNIGRRYLTRRHNAWWERSGSKAWGIIH